MMLFTFRAPVASGFMVAWWGVRRAEPLGRWWAVTASWLGSWCCWTMPADIVPHLRGTLILVLATYREPTASYDTSAGLLPRLSAECQHGTGGPSWPARRHGRGFARRRAAGIGRRGPVRCGAHSCRAGVGEVILIVVSLLSHQCGSIRRAGTSLPVTH
jgi:hypothetical protein